MKINSFWRKDMAAAEARAGRGFLQVNVVNGSLTLLFNIPLQKSFI